MNGIPNGQFIVYRDDFQIITWNGSATFNVYFQMEEDRWVNMECFTEYDVESFEQAKQVAIDTVDLNNEILEN